MVKIAPAPENYTVKENKGTWVKSQTFLALNNNGKAIPMSVSRFRDTERRTAPSNGYNRIRVSPYFYLRKETVSIPETSFRFLKQCPTDKFQQLDAYQTEHTRQHYTCALSTSITEPALLPQRRRDVMAPIHSFIPTEKEIPGRQVRSASKQSLIYDDSTHT